MSVLRIEEYGNVLKVILKPTKTFPSGYFYCNADAIDLVESYSWFLKKQGRQVYVLAHAYGQKILYFHQEYAKKVLSYYPAYIDHINGLEIDNRDINLNVVSQQQNMRNQPSRGYYFDARCNVFQPIYKLNKKTNHRGSYRTESNALTAVYYLRQEMYSDYNYNFYLDRRGDEDILDAELTRKITTQQAIYLHVKRYAGTNPWYVYRYNLFEYCKENHIQIPSFSLDSQGFMINPHTGQRLCPY